MDDRRNGRRSNNDSSRSRPGIVRNDNGYPTPTKMCSCNGQQGLSSRSHGDRVETKHGKSRVQGEIPKSRFEVFAPQADAVYTTDPEDELKILTGNKDITISTPKIPHSGRCINPSECEYSKSLSRPAATAMLDTHDALKSAMDSFNARSFEEVEEMLEIQHCTEIQRKLELHIQEKKEKLKKKADRRAAELRERKIQFGKNVITHIKKERDEDMKLHNDLLTLLDNAKGPDEHTRMRSSADSGSELDVTRSKQNLHYRDFEPGAESTRIMPNPSKVTVTLSTRDTCQCSKNQQEYARR